jgi:hypothetical protein
VSLPPIDWTLPGLAPWRATGTRAWQAAQGSSVAQALDALAPAAGPRFVPQAELPAGEAYEAYISRTGRVPTRDNAHDFFNGLVWLVFPQAKRRLNRLQAGEIARLGIGSTRGALRDASTLFDENGAVLDAPPALWDALLARDWLRLFVAQRALWAQARLLVFGHALMEKILAGHPAATAHVLCGRGAAPSIAADDAAIAQALDAAHLSAKPFTPLPVFGIPGWHAGNCEPSFYDDRGVFRPRRAAITSNDSGARTRRTP